MTLRLALAGLAAVLAALASPALAAPCAIGTPGATASVAIGDTGRSMLVHMPTGFDPARPAPLLFLFHGSTSNGAEMLRASQLEVTADAHGFVLVAPDGGIPAGGGFVWNIPGVPSVTGAMPSPDAPDDVAYVAASIDFLVAQGCVDRARVYATGLSGGGRMTSLLGCVAAERFAAIAPVVGLRAGNPLAVDPQRPDPATCRPTRPVPVIAFAGDKDTTNPIEGGGGRYWQYPMAAAERRWAELDGCRAVPAHRDVTPQIYEDRYVGCAADTEVVARITRGGTHSWVVDNEALWAFLIRYRR